MQYKSAVQEFLVECEIKNYTKKTLKSYRNNLEYFGRWFGIDRELSDLNLPIIKLFIKSMKGKKQPTSTLY